MKKKMYLRLQLRRALRLYPSILLITTITLCGIALSAMLLMQKTMGSEEKQKVSIGIVGDISDTYLGVGIYALKNMDSSRFTIDFLEMEEGEARAALEKREITGYVQVPEDFIDGIINGENIPATFVTHGGPEGFGTILTSEITGTVSDLVTESQRVLYAMQELARDTGETEGLWDKVKMLNIELIDLILGRSGAYVVESLGIADAVSMGGYYICGIYIFFLLLWGISCSRFMMGRNREMHRLLKARGCSAARQVLCEYAAFFLITLGTMLLFSLFAGFITARQDFGIRELVGSGFLSPAGFVLQSIPVLCVLTAMQFCLYETTDSTISAVLLQFLTAIGMGYICGCLYPLPFFPDAVQRVGNVLPAGAGFSYLRKCMAGIPIGNTIGVIVFYAAAFLVLAICMRQHRIIGDTK